MLRYCEWCGVYQGATPHPGYQIRSNVCEIDTSTICPTCLARIARAIRDEPFCPAIRRTGTKRSR